MNKTLMTMLAALVLPLAAHAADLNAWSPQEVEHPSSVSLQSFLDRIKSIDGEHFTPKFQPVASVANQAVLLKNLRSGDLGVAVLNGSAISKLAPSAQVLQLPFIFRDSKQMFGVLDGDIGKTIEKELRDKGVVLLGWYDGGTRSFYLHNKPARATADFQGLKVRVPNRADLKNLITVMGGTPVPLPYDGVNAAFDSGVINSAENDLVSYEADQHYKHAKYVLMSNHFVQFEALVMSEAVWKTLSDADKKAFRDAAKESAMADRDLWAKRTVAARAKLEKEGVKFIDPGSAAPFISRVSEIYKPFMDNPATSSVLLRLMTERG